MLLISFRQLLNQNRRTIGVERKSITSLVASEARQSIRESLRVFSQIEEQLEDDIDMSFEHMMGLHGYSGSNNNDDTQSCGRTMRCFAALFLGKQQTNYPQMEYLLNGTAGIQLLNHPNIVMHSFAHQNFNLLFAGHDLNKGFKNCAAFVSRQSSQRGFRILQSAINQYDDESVLPRVLFCSLAWVSPEATVMDTLSPRFIIQRSLCASHFINDHKFTIIKHSNTRFQLLQGHIEQSFECGPNLGTILNIPGLDTLGFGLAEWQRHESMFSSRHGFAAVDMAVFLISLRKFVENEQFDGVDYESMFGVRPSGGHAYWPALSHRELADSSIVGCGERHYADAVEASLVKQSIAMDAL